MWLRLSFTCTLPRDGDISRHKSPRYLYSTSVADVKAAQVNLLNETWVVNYLRQPFHLLYRLPTHNNSEKYESHASASRLAFRCRRWSISVLVVRDGKLGFCIVCIAGNAAAPCGATIGHEGTIAGSHVFPMERVQSKLSKEGSILTLSPLQARDPHRSSSLDVSRALEYFPSSMWSGLHEVHNRLCLQSTQRRVSQHFHS